MPGEDQDPGSYYVGVDVGTGSVRAALVDQRGVLLAFADQPINQWEPRFNHHEQSSEEIWAACCAVTKKVVQGIDGNQIRGLGFDATCSLVVLDQQFHPLPVNREGDSHRNVIMWLDHRAVSQVHRINETKHGVLQCVGGVMSVEMQAPKLLWLKENLRETCWDKAGHFFDLPDFLSWKATGVTARSLCSLVCKWTYSADKGWDDSFWKMIGLEDFVEDNYSKIGNQVLPPGTSLGNGLTPEAAKDLGLPAGIAVAASLIDAHAGGLGVIGADVRGHGLACEGQPVTSRLAVICGTSSCHMGVSNQRAGWKMPLLLTLCLLQAANALKGPRLVSGELGGTVTIQCRYAPLSINKYERKYWCRLSPLTWFCHTIVSTTHYTHLGYRGRVALTDFPQRGLFVVRLSQLSPDDAGHYRCGIGKKNDMFFFSMNLTVPAGLSSTVPTPTLAAGELGMASLGTASPAANGRTPGTSWLIERQGTGFHKVALTPGARKTATSAEARQTPGTSGAVALGTGSRVEGPVWTTVPAPESLASTIGGVSNTTEGVWAWDSRGSVGNTVRPGEEGREVTTSEASSPQEETERVRAALDVAGKVIGTMRSTTLVSEKWMQEILQETTAIPKPQALAPIERTTPGAGVWTPGPSSIEAASPEGATEGDLDTPAGHSHPQATPSQALAAAPWRPLGKESSMKRASPGEKNISRILTPVSTVLFPLALVALVLLQRRLRRNSMPQETETAAGVTLIQMTQLLELCLQPGQLPRMERKMFWDDSPTRVSLTVPERHPGPQGMEQ